LARDADLPINLLGGSVSFTGFSYGHVGRKLEADGGFESGAGARVPNSETKVETMSRKDLGGNGAFEGERGNGRSSEVLDEKVAAGFRGHTAIVATVRREVE
jgi:hypothetical protein